MKFNIIGIKKLLLLKRFSVLIIPDNTELNTKTHRFSFKKVIVVIIIYSFIMAFLGFLIFNLTPLNSLFFAKSSNLSSTELRTINELNERMIKISKELNEIRNNDEKLKKALKLGDSTIFNKENSANNTKIKSGGALLSVFRELLLKFHIVQKENISFIKPVVGFISRNFDPERGHLGIDFVVKTGSPVYVSANGFIIFANYTVKDGNMIIVSHPGNYISVYKHCLSLLKRERDTVIQGELIALSGNSGEMTTGPHLHFEIWKEGKPINPITILVNN
jgi:murein DD-endopeptidase MepM/ murein hydrolase activator NlpD